MQWDGFFILKSGKLFTLPPGADHSAIKPRWYENGLIRVRLYGGSKYNRDGLLAMECKSLSAKQKESLSVEIGSILSKYWIYGITLAVGKTAPLVIATTYRIRKFECGGPDNV